MGNTAEDRDFCCLGVHDLLSKKNLGRDSVDVWHRLCSEGPVATALVLSCYAEAG